MFPHTKPPAGTQINPLHPLSRGLVGCWLFNEGAGSLANDISGNKNHGRLTNMAPNVQGSGWCGSEFGGGLDYDGVDDYVDLLQVVSNPTEISWSVWFKSAVSDITEQRILVYNNDGIFIITSINGGTQNLIRVYSNADSGGGWSDTTIAHNVTQWHHIVATSKNGDYLRLYVDGQEIGTGTAIGNMQDLGIDFARYIGISRQLSYPANGSIDSVNIYNRALSATEVKQLYEDPFCNMMKTPINRYYVAVVGGLSMAVAMHHYNQMKEN